MARAKKVIGDHLPIGGAVPISILSVGTKDEVIAEVKKEIKDMGAGGGYIMMTSATLEDTPPANIKTMVEACKQYGVYK